MRKRMTAMVLCAALMMTMSVAVCAEQPESMQTLSKTYMLRISETYGAIEATPITAAFWEYPFLRAGEDYAEGTLTIHNNSEYTTSMELDDVMLPYGDDAKLDYLDHLELTVSEGESILYDNTYAHINDEEGGLKIALEAMAPGEQHVYTIKLRCRYDYAGDPYADASQMAWIFSAKTQNPTENTADTEGLAPWIQVTILGGVATGALMILTLLIYGVIVLVRKKKKTIDNADEV